MSTSKSTLPSRTAKRAFRSSTALLAALVLCLPLAARADGADDADGVVPPGAKVRKVADGFRFTEGPAWSPDGFLLFSDIPNDRIVELAADGSARDFLKPSGGANGLMFDAAGVLYACQGSARQVARIEVQSDKKLVPLAAAFDGKKLNSPNDLALDAHGGLYFTDPRYGGAEPVEQPVMGVYYIDATGKISRVIDSLERPNGILVSPDGKWLYVAEPNKRELHRFAIEKPGVLGERTLLYTGDQETDGGGPDGMALDAGGRIYTTYKGIVILAPDGKRLGRIEVPERPANCAFGGKDGKTLFITARTSLYAIDLQVQGMALQARGPGTAKEAGTAPSSTATRDVKAGGLALKVPASWKEEKPTSTMRAAQLLVPAAEGDKEGAELIVFYFGAGGAGPDQANVDRWIGMFSAEGRKSTTREGKSSAGAYVLAEITGTYLKRAGPPGAGGEATPVPGSKMLGAIVKTESGPYYVRLTGPAKTVDGSRKDFLKAFGVD
jgi:gluconolactonase